jgi:hypothetical protein
MCNLEAAFFFLVLSLFDKAGTNVEYRSMANIWHSRINIFILKFYKFHQSPGRERKTTAQHK